MSPDVSWTLCLSTRTVYIVSVMCYKKHFWGQLWICQLVISVCITCSLTGVLTLERHCWQTARKDFTTLLRATRSSCKHITSHIISQVSNIMSTLTEININSNFSHTKCLHQWSNQSLIILICYQVTFRGRRINTLYVAAGRDCQRAQRAQWATVN